MAKGKIPMRMCTGCREMKSKRELIRVVRSVDGEICLDTTGKKNGRGAYICKSSECLARAQKANAFSRAFEMAVPPEIYEQLKKELQEIEG